TAGSGARPAAAADDLDQRIERVGRGEDAHQATVGIVDDHAADLALGHQEGDFLQRTVRADADRLAGHDVGGGEQLPAVVVQPHRQAHVAVADHADHGTVAHHRQVADAVRVHQPAQLVDRHVRAGGNRIGCGELLDGNPD